MIITDYYRFQKTAAKSKMRLDCVASTGSYPILEDMRAAKAIKVSEKRDAINIGDLFLYCGAVPDRFGGDVHRKASLALTKNNNVSSIYIPDVSLDLGFGDVRGTADALLFVLRDFKMIDGGIVEGAVLEVFVCRGKAHDKFALYQLLADGQLEDEMDLLRLKAAEDL